MPGGREGPATMGKGGGIPRFTRRSVVASGKDFCGVSTAIAFPSIPGANASNAGHLCDYPARAPIRQATASKMTATAKSGYWEKGILSTAKSRARIQRMKAGVSILPESGVGWEWMGKERASRFRGGSVGEGPYGADS